MEGTTPVIARGLGAAHSAPEFERVSSLLTARAVIAHVRLASVGKVGLPNAHPFSHGAWTFAHNGTLREFDRHRAAVEACIAPQLRERLVGDTDSERCFYLFLSHLFARLPSEDAPAPLRTVASALVQTVNQVASITDVEGSPPSSMNFMVCDGKLLVATRRQRTLYASVGPRRRKADAPGLPPNGVTVSQVMLASEELSLDSHWHPVKEDSVVGVDETLRVFSWPFAALASALPRL